MQSSLFELFGEGERSFEVLFEVMGKSESIQKVTEGDLRGVAESKGDATTTTTSATAASSAQRHEHMHKLRAEAFEAADLATALRTDLDILNNNAYSSRGTHSVTRKSDKEAMA